MFNRKFNNTLLAGLMVIGSMVPAMAADENKPEVQKGSLNAAQVRVDGARGGKFLAYNHGGKCGGGRHHRGMHRGFHKRGVFGPITSRLNLTPDQDSKIYTIKTSFMEQARPKFTELMATRQQLRDLMTQPNVDKSQALNLESKINADRDALANLKLSTKLDELAVLTPAQRQQIRDGFVKMQVEGPGAFRG